MNYSLQARFFPVALSAIPLAFALSYGYVIHNYPLVDLVSKATMIMAGLIPSSIITAAIGFFLRDFVRWFSIITVQRIFFGKNGENCPTTTMLLWSTADSPISSQYKTLIAQKVNRDFGISLMNAQEEADNLHEAKKRICDCVSMIRNRTRDDKILLGYNIAYGFARNSIGAGFLSFIGLLLVSLYINFAFMMPILIGIQFLLIIFWTLTIKSRAVAYAKALFAAYTNVSI